MKKVSNMFLNKLKNCDEHQRLLKDGKIKIITEIKKEEKESYENPNRNNDKIMIMIMIMIIYENNDNEI